MKELEKQMIFDVYADLHSKEIEYTIRIDLETEIDSLTRETAIGLAGAMVRNYHKNKYEINTKEELSELIKNKLNRWMPKSTRFMANDVKLDLKLQKARAK